MSRQVIKVERSTTAEQALVRALVFLRAASSDPGVRAALTTTGFGARDVDEGWALLRAACSSPAPAPPAPERPTDVLDATRALEIFTRTMLPRARAVTRRFHPTYEAFLFATRGGRGASITIAAVFVERCDELRSSPTRRKFRKRDAEVLAALASRGVTAAVLEDARRNVAIATGGMPRPEPRAPKSLPRASRAALDALHAWVRDWSDCARTVITRRDWLIRLGIGRRRPRRRKRVTAE